MPYHVTHSFPDYVTSQTYSSEMNKALWQIGGATLCDVGSTMAAPGRESFPLAFGRKWLGMTLSVVASAIVVDRIRAALKTHRRSRAVNLRTWRVGFGAAACGWNLAR